MPCGPRHPEVLCFARPMSISRENLGMVFWIIPLCLQPLIALSITLRRLISRFPIFFSYTLLVSARDLILLFFKHNRRMYSWIYFLGEPLAIVLGLAVIYEVLWQLIRPYATLRTLGIRSFWVTVCVALLAGLWILQISQFGQSQFWIDSLVLIERSARFAQVGVLIGFILFISHLGLTWKHYVAGIVVGFGVAAGFQLAVFELRSTQVIPAGTFHLLDSGAYNIAVLVWAIYFLPPRREMEPPPTLPKTDLPRWDEVLRGYLHQ